MMKMTREGGYYRGIHYAFSTTSHIARCDITVQGCPRILVWKACNYTSIKEAELENLSMGTEVSEGHEKHRITPSLWSRHLVGWQCHQCLMGARGMQSSFSLERRGMRRNSFSGELGERWISFCQVDFELLGHLNGSENREVDSLERHLIERYTDSK